MQQLQRETTDIAVFTAEEHSVDVADHQVGLVAASRTDCVPSALVSVVK